MGQWVLISAGEASGDLHGANLVRALKNKSPHLAFFGIGGAQLKAEGIDLIANVTPLASIGPFEGISTYRRLVRIFFQLLKETKKRKPSAAVLIDYPEFNMRLAPRLKRLGIPVFYYIVPQVWAWRSHRVSTLANFTDMALCVLPFEEAWLRRHGVNAHFVGHPLLDVVPDPETLNAAKSEFVPEDRPLVALLPGSRRHEVKRLLPLMLEAAERISRRVPVSFCVSRAASVPKRLFAPSPYSLTNKTYRLPAAADGAVVTSGSATLEAALLLCPPVVIYRVSTPTFLLLRWLLHTRTYALCNIAAGKPVAEELIQYRATPNRIAKAVHRLLDERLRRDKVEALKRLKQRLGSAGVANRVASLILNYLGG
ncbi:MAG: lipid-A-disaccharide synthase [Planctomycetota bacterium]|nr:MAG: lipid-A-disaccharide synthase [Planctomycetota bacterium]